MAVWKKALLAVIAMIVVLAVAAFLFADRIVLYALLGRHVDAEVRPIDEDRATQVQLLTEDELRLQAWDFAPLSTHPVEHSDTAGQPDPKGAVIVLSGLQGPSVTWLHEYGELLQDNGYAALLVEMRGVAGSEGDGQEAGMGEVRDIRAGIDYLSTTYPGTPVAVWGTSMGGHAALAALDFTDPEHPIAAVIAASAITSFADMAGQYNEALVAPIGERLATRYGKYGAANALHAITHATVPVLLAYSREDSVVPATMSQELKAAYPAAEEYVVDGDHHFIVPADSDGFTHPVAEDPYADAVIEFLDRSLSE